MEDLITASLQSHAHLLDQMMRNNRYLDVITQAADACIASFRLGGKVMFCGNGGSAADAQHLASELSGRYLIDRPPLFAEALNVNSSYLTAVGNDYGFAEVFARAVEAKGSKGDVLVAMSTSGRSSNIISALTKARAIGLTTISFTSVQDETMRTLSDHYLAVPSKETPRIQEMHILFGHILCDIIERALFA